jgi:hypothetical protein
MQRTGMEINKSVSRKFFFVPFGFFRCFPFVFLAVQSVQQKQKKSRTQWKKTAAHDAKQQNIEILR